MDKCNMCPRMCGIDRSKKAGYCGEKSSMRIARIAPHYFEEPPISGTRGSGTIFFSGCSLKCIFCQNRDISRPNSIGKIIEPQELYNAILELQKKQVHNINLVTPTHFLHNIVPVLTKLKSSGKLKIPVVYNSSGYESLDSLRRLEGLVDIYMPDLKYFSSDLSKKYSSASDYFSVACSAIKEMLRQVGEYKFSKDEPNILQSGLIVRHLVLPGCRQDSMRVLEGLSTLVPPDKILLSLMSQYTPSFAMDTPYKELHRTVTTFEYSSVVNKACELGFDGFIQNKDSASSIFTPSFR